jgi:single-strand DNA-binding protein
MNSVILAGRLGQDPDERTTTGGKSVVSFSIATQDTRDAPTWHRCVAWERTAEAAARLRKGDFATVRGRISNRTYEKDGEAKHVTEIVVHEITYGPRSDAGAAPTPKRDAPAARRPTVEVDDDEIPF